MKNKKIVPVLIFAVFIGLGIVFLFMGINATKAQKELYQHCTAEVQGTVTGFTTSGYHSDDKDEDERRYHAIFEYEVNNKTYVQNQATGAKVKGFKAGEKVTVLYNPANPDEYHVPADKATAGNPGLMTGFGVFILATAALLILKTVLTRK